MENPVKRRGLLQVAEVAGVSLSTVDRVLNERGSVSDTKRRKVLAVARALGVRPGLPPPLSGPLHIDVLLADSDTDHFKRMDAAFSRLVQRLHPRLVLRQQRWPMAKPAALLDALRKPGARRQGLIVYAPDIESIREALEAVVRSGTPTVLLTSNLEVKGASFVGIDNYAAGRTAGRLMSRWLDTREGAVLLVVNSLQYNAHRLRAKGFTDVMARHAPKVRIIGPVECLDDPDLTEAAVTAALAAEPVVGLYDTGCGTTGICRVLKHTGHTPVWIGHEASEQHAELLREGLLSLVLDQDPEGQARASIDYLLYVHGVLPTPPLTQLALKIVVDENLPA